MKLFYLLGDGSTASNAFCVKWRRWVHLFFLKPLDSGLLFKAKPSFRKIKKNDPTLSNIVTHIEKKI
jgi:hypothetical protein